MRRAALVLLTLLLATSALVACSDDDDGADPPAQAAAIDTDGVLPDGSTWRLVVPEEWNGTLLVYSHGAVAEGKENRALVAPDEITATALLDAGYALTAGSYPDTGWVVAKALPDQLSLLDVVAPELPEEPELALAWGSSMGGLITVGLVEQHPDRFDGGLAMCGIVAGADRAWDGYLDVTFALRTLLAPTSDLSLADFADGADAVKAFEGLRSAGRQAQGTPQGRARLALAAAIGAVPPWTTVGAPRPAANDPVAQEAEQALQLVVLADLGTTGRHDVESKFGGNPSSNVGVDYAALLTASETEQQVQQLYAAAGLDLAADLAALAAAPRIAADPAARDAFKAPVSPTGELEVPLMTLHGPGDGLAVIQHERAYADLAAAAGTTDLLRQATVDRAGHCSFTASEMVSAVDVLHERLTSPGGTWPDTSADELRDRAEALGEDRNVLVGEGTLPAEPAFVDLTPKRFGPRP